MYIQPKRCFPYIWVFFARLLKTPKRYTLAETLENKMVITAIFCHRVFGEQFCKQFFGEKYTLRN